MRCFAAHSREKQASAAARLLMSSLSAVKAVIIFDSRPGMSSLYAARAENKSVRAAGVPGRTLTRAAHAA
jgi:hypothetical protein